MQANIGGFVEQARERRKTAMVGRLSRINEELNKEDDSEDDENNFNNSSKIEKFKEPSVEYEASNSDNKSEEEKILDPSKQISEPLQNQFVKRKSSDFTVHSIQNLGIGLKPKISEQPVQKRKLTIFDKFKSKDRVDEISRI